MNDKTVINIDLASQRLFLQTSDVNCRYDISTAKAGAGEQFNSGCTPLGSFRIRKKIGFQCPINSVFVGRRPTGEIYTDELAKKHPNRDWILSRILWLTGCEPGINRGGQVDTLRRYIYIHGTPDTEPMGTACSHGCIRMRNADILQLFDYVSENDCLLIE